jgi:Lrp/AsnC family transcriptional regulator
MQISLDRKENIFLLNTRRCNLKSKFIYRIALACGFDLQGAAAAKMDSIDRKILRYLQDDSSISIAELADRVGLSQTPCWKRIQRLESSGVIAKRVALVSPERIGLGLTVFVSIETSDHSGEWLGKFAAFVAAMPEVMDFYRMAGDVDYMLRVVVADMSAYDLFYKRLIAEVPLKNVTSRFAMERIKSTTAYAVAEPA